MNSKLLEAIKALPASARKSAKALLRSRGGRKSTGKGENFDARKVAAMKVLNRAGLSFRQVEEIAGLKDRNGNNAYDLINANKPKAKKAKKAKIARKPKAKVVKPKARKAKKVARKVKAIAAKAIAPTLAPATTQATVAATATPATVVTAPAVPAPAVPTPAPAPQAQAEVKAEAQPAQA